MEALVAIHPTLDSEILDKYHVKVLNYSKDSNSIELDGDTENVQKARHKIEALMSSFCVTEISFEHSSFLLDSAERKIKESGFKVRITKPEEKNKMKPICLTLSSFSPKQLEKAAAILRGPPIYKSLKIPSGSCVDSVTLKKIQSAVRKECQVLIRPIYKQKVCTSLVISGYVRSDVGDAHKKLQDELLNRSRVEATAKPKPTPQQVTLT